jgi:hypothetical protein
MTNYSKSYYEKNKLNQQAYNKKWKTLNREKYLLTQKKYNEKRRKNRISNKQNSSSTNIN